MAAYRYVAATSLVPGDVIVKYDNRFHPNGKLNAKKRGVVIEQSELRTVISWLEGTIEHIYDRRGTEVLVECSV